MNAPARNLMSVRKGVTPGDLYRNLVLENVSVASFQNPSDFIARAWFPTISGEEQVGKYFVLNQDTIAQNKMAIRAPGAKAESGTWDMSLASYTCEQFGYREKLPEELLMAGGPAGSADAAAAGSVAEVALINEELRIASLAFVTGVWKRDMVGAGSAVANVSYVYWNNSASTPILDVAAESVQIKLNSRRRPNTMILGALVLPQLINHPTIIARVNAGQTPGGAAMAQLPYDAQLRVLAQCFGVDRVLVASGVYNSAAEGQATAVNAFCLDSKSAWLGYVNPTPSIFTPSAGYRFTWKIAANGNDQGIRNWRYWQQDIRSFWVEVAVDDTFKVVMNTCGTFFSAIVQ